MMPGPYSTTVFRIPVLLACVLATSVGCERQADAPPSPDAQDRPLRVVSLSPALSRIMVDLDVADRIVGVGEYDDAAPPGLPVVGTYMDVNSEKIYALKPTHVLTMAGRSGVPASLQSLARTMDFELVGYPVPDSVERIRDIVLGDGNLPGLGSLLGVSDRAEALAARMLSQFEALRNATSTANRIPTVLLVFSVEPTVMASGPGTVLNSMLPYAGGVNAAGDATSTAPTFDREKLLAANPDVVLLLMPGAPKLEAMDVDSRLAVFRGLDIAAVRNGRIHMVNDPLTLLPGSTTPRIAKAMAKAIHPDLAEAIDHATAGQATDLAGSNR